MPKIGEATADGAEVAATVGGGVGGTVGEVKDVAMGAGDAAGPPHAATTPRTAMPTRPTVITSTACHPAPTHRNERRATGALTGRFVVECLKIVFGGPEDGASQLR